MPPKAFFVTNILYNWIRQFQISSEMVLKHLMVVTLTFDPQINRVHLLPRIDVWTKFEEDGSGCSRFIDQKRKGYKRTNRPTCAKQYALSSSKGA